MDAMDLFCYWCMLICVCMACWTGYGIYDTLEHEKNYGLGSEVTTTNEYEKLCNDSFTGIVVRGEGWHDSALTIRNTTGKEQRIATKFLEPVKRV